MAKTDVADRAVPYLFLNFLQPVSPRLYGHCIMALSKVMPLLNGVPLNRGIKLSDLTDDIKLLVTKYLPNLTKIKLVDIFPPVASLVLFQETLNY